MTYLRDFFYLLESRQERMKNTRFGSRFFESTRGRIVLLLRESAKTVNQLAEALGLTDNAVRAHLLSLERDRLIETGGTVKGFRKPHTIYRLTDEGREHFPRAYGTLFNRFVSVLKSHLTPKSLIGNLRETGQELGSELAVSRDASDKEKLEKCIVALEELGGAARIVRENGRTLISSESCPFAEAVAEHPEVCQVAEAMIAEMTDKPVREVCDRTSRPRCRFLVDIAPTPS